MLLIIGKSPGLHKEILELTDDDSCFFGIGLNESFVLSFPVFELLVLDFFDLQFFGIESPFFEILLFDVVAVLVRLPHPVDHLHGLITLIFNYLLIFNLE